MFRIIPRELLTEPKAEVIEDTGSTATLRIEGLVCSACASNVGPHLERVPGVCDVTVDLDSGEAHVTYDPSSTARAELVPAIQRSVWFPGVRHLIHKLAHRG